MSTKENIRILLVDDYASIRKRLRTLLESVPEFEVVGEAENGKIAMELTQKLLPDVVIMDLNMPITDGTEATRWITSVSSVIKVVAFISSNNDIRKMIEAGASDILLKTCKGKEIILAVKSVVKRKELPAEKRLLRGQFL